MPSSATITAFYNFTANTKARASQVNGNFDVFRGHLIPVEPLTATSADNTYDIGSSEYYWRTGYFSSLDLRTSTSTATLSISGDTTDTTGSFVFKIEGTEVARITPNAWTFGADTSIFSLAQTLAATDITNGSISIKTFNRPIEVGLCPMTNLSAAGSLPYLVLNRSTSSANIVVQFIVYRNTTTSIVYSTYVDMPAGSNTNDSRYFPITLLNFTDFVPGDTTNTYFIRSNWGISYQNGTSAVLNGYRIFARRTI